MRPSRWHPPVDLAVGEQAIVQRIRRAKLFVFLRRHRREIFSDAFQDELATLYQESRVGQPPLPPAQLALATILQAYCGVSDDEVIEATLMDRRWQLVLDCLDCPHPPFSKGALVGFRALLIAHDGDRRLIERTIEIAEQTREVGPRQLRAALDSSPLWGAGRVEDTYNLLGHALRKALGVIARQQGRGLAEVAAEAGAPVVGGPSLKAALDRDWDDPAERGAALRIVLDALDGVEDWVAAHPLAPTTPTDTTPEVVTASLAAAQQVVAQDVETASDGTPVLRRGVAKDRRISVEDAQMRHGRKSRSHLFDGFKRHVLRDLDQGVIRAVALTPANAPEATATDDITADLARQAGTLAELHLDRAYLSSSLVRDRPSGLVIYCKAWPVRNRWGFPKTAFTLDWEAQTITCPQAVVIPFHAGHTVRFPEEECGGCPLRARCTTSRHGRSIAIHPDERLLAELRERQTTAVGRAKLRERVGVEHALAHIGHWQGDRARYRGVRKNLFDVRRAAVVHNLHVIARSPDQSKVA
ncbi:MAG: IS1182 family transposase [Chloroflexota bacterium]